jgi:hypothetical protein
VKPDEREALRQQMLLRALWGDARPGVVAGWLRDGSRTARGLSVYRANAAAAAERALAAAYPTVQQLLGEKTFAALARGLWQRRPPVAGDLGVWGADLAAFIADAESLAEEAYLPDMARLEWALHRAGRAADAGPPQQLQDLAVNDPVRLRLQLAPGTAVLASDHPIVSIWQAHRRSGDDRYDAARQALAEGRGETARITRQGWRAQVQAISPDEGRFLQATLASRNLADALGAAGPGFDFQAWLIQALQQGLLAAVQGLPPAAPGTP